MDPKGDGMSLSSGAIPLDALAASREETDLSDGVVRMGSVCHRG